MPRRGLGDDIDAVIAQPRMLADTAFQAAHSHGIKRGGITDASGNGDTFHTKIMFLGASVFIVASLLTNCDVSLVRVQRVFMFKVW